MSQKLYLAATAWTQVASPATTSPKEVTNSITVEKENVHSEGVHHYQDSAEEAEDAALIIKIKTALATDGVANGHPVEIDCDHGVARLRGWWRQLAMRSMRPKSPLPFLESGGSITS